MNDQILSDDEKNALLEGVERGDVEVHSSSGPRYATVEPFSIAPHNCIVSNSFPRLQKLNRNLAGSFGKSVSVLLNEKADVLAGPVDIGSWADFSARSASPAVLFEFSASPLSGSAVVFVASGLVRHIVETFFGGLRVKAGRPNSGDLTPGELSVTALFCEQLLGSIVSAWRGLAELKPARVGVHRNTDTVEVLESSAEIVSCRFDVRIGGEDFHFDLVWPTGMLAPLLPVLEGQKKNRNAAEDARWEQVLRSRVPDARVALTSCIGSARLTLRKVADLAAGDIIDLEQPRRGTVFAGPVPVLEGRFGVHEGRYAIEAGRWLGNGSAPA